METDNHGGDLWIVANSSAFILLTVIIFVGIFFGLQTISNAAEIRNNWATHRCSPSIMPFASFYGYDTNDNFNFCMGNIFTAHTGNMTSSFTGVLSTFTGIIATLMGAINSIRNSVATLGGGINVVFQNITDRISNFFFQLRISAIRIKSLIGRMYAIMFSVLYMGLSAITGLESFSKTVLFDFLDVFCFPPDTSIEIQREGEIHKTAVSDVKIGDVLHPTKSRVCSVFNIHAKGQKMVRFNKSGNFIVSTNHYISHNNSWIRADEHPDATPGGTWNSDTPLVCFNTDNHQIPVGGYVFCDYDETSTGDHPTMNMIDSKINGKVQTQKFPFTEYAPALGSEIKIVMKNGSIKKVAELKIGDKLNTGSYITGIVQREVTEICEMSYGKLTPATCIWIGDKWERLGVSNKYIYEPCVMTSLITTPNCQIEIKNGSDNIRIRDYMELCSPDAEEYYKGELQTIHSDR